jgi:hypothetical protein
MEIRMKKTILFVLGLILVCPLIVGYSLTSGRATQEPGLNRVHISSLFSNWTYYKVHNITGSTAGAQTDYQMKFTLHYGSGTDRGEHVYLDGLCQGDFDDIRFAWYNTSSSLEVGCDYWLEEKVDYDNATFWVEITYIPMYPANATIHVYYGNPNVTTASNGFNTFLIFDDFEDDNWADRWEPINSTGTITESAGILTLETEDGSIPNRIILRSKSNFTGQTVELMSLMKHTQHWDRGRYLNVGIDMMSDREYAVGSCPIDGDYNVIRASEYYQEYTTDYTMITGIILAKNHLHRLTFRGTDTEIYVDYYDLESDVHYDVAHTYSLGFSWDSESVYKIRLVNVHWSDGSGGDGYQTDQYYWLALRKYLSPEPTHSVPAWVRADLNQDGRVDMRDVGIVARAFGSYPGHERWNIDADITGSGGEPDNRVDMRDIGLVARNFGQPSDSLYSLPAKALLGDHRTYYEAELLRIDVDPALGDQPETYVFPGQHIVVNLTLQIWEPRGPSIINQALMIYSWSLT